MAGTVVDMVDKDPVVAKDEEELEHLEKDIEVARRHLKEQTHEGERTFISDGSESGGEVDDAIAPPG
jgi:hypothetical protein